MSRYALERRREVAFAPVVFARNTRGSTRGVTRGVLARAEHARRSVCLSVCRLSARARVRRRRRPRRRRGGASSRSLRPRDGIRFLFALGRGRVGIRGVSLRRRGAWDPSDVRGRLLVANGVSETGVRGFAFGRLEHRGARLPAAEVQGDELRRGAEELARRVREPRGDQPAQLTSRGAPRSLKRALAGHNARARARVARLAQARRRRRARRALGGSARGVGGGVGGSRFVLRALGFFSQSGSDVPRHDRLRAGFDRPAGDAHAELGERRDRYAELSVRRFLTVGFANARFAKTTVRCVFEEVRRERLARPLDAVLDAVLEKRRQKRGAGGAVDERSVTLARARAGCVLVRDRPREREVVPHRGDRRQGTQPERREGRRVFGFVRPLVFALVNIDLFRIRDSVRPGRAQVIRVEQKDQVAF